MLNAETKKMFWGLPMGVHMEPRFAVKVMATTVAMVARGVACINRARASGTNVMSATSLVTSMAEIKTTLISIKVSVRADPTRVMSQSRMALRSPALPRPATTVIRQNNRPMVRMSI